MRERFAQWRVRVENEEKLRALRAKVCIRVRDDVLRHWSLCVELSKTGARAALRRAWYQWRDTMHIRARALTFRDRAVEMIVRSRERGRHRAAFSAWVLEVSNAKRARIFAMELLANERREKSFLKLRSMRGFKKSHFQDIVDMRHENE
jgi:hypothetical protein